MSIEGIFRLTAHTALVATVLFALWAAARLWILAIERKKGTPPPSRGTEILLWVFVFYLICLYQITVFRYGISPGLWHDRPDPLASVNLAPFVHTIKLYYAYTKWYFVYNLLGNIVWFVPFGAAVPAVGRRSDKKRGFLSVTAMGFLCSLSIELLQFVFATGISDVDDLIFNTVGTALGYLLYLCAQSIYKRVRSR
ncbi:MAG: VanZ family protein [Acetanaerobacterium sp.]